jgi:hypothetical protein
MVEFERRVGPWVEKTLADALVRRGVADEGGITDN